MDNDKTRSVEGGGAFVDPEGGGISSRTVSSDNNKGHPSRNPRGSLLFSSSSSPSPPTVSSSSSLARYFILVLCLFGCITLFFNGRMLQFYDAVSIGTTTGLSSTSAAAAAAVKGWRALPQSGTIAAMAMNLHEFAVGRLQPEEDASEEGGEHAKMGHLSCQAFPGGPSDDLAQEMVYWKDIPGDAYHRSPFHAHFRRDNNEEEGRGQDEEEEQYLTFEPDEGGFNNIRMSFETIVSLAFAMGRTLVLPPEDRIYLLQKTKGHDGKEHNNQFSFAHFFDLTAVHEEHVGLKIITMEQFLQRNAVQTGKLFDSSKVLKNNRTNWNGDRDKLLKNLRDVVRNVLWDMDSCLAAFPTTSKESDIQVLLNSSKSIIELRPRVIWEDYLGKPVPVNGPTLDRLKEHWMGRSKICIYDQELQNLPVIHMGANRGGIDNGRLLIHFYAFLFHQDWQHDLWLKRFVRDHLYYRDEIQCAAARIVVKLRELSFQRRTVHLAAALPNESAEAFRTGENLNSSSPLIEQTTSPYAFDTMHIRRGDFQYKNTRISAQDILKQAKRLIPANATLYIATDERDKSFFAPFREYYDVYFMDDFKDLLVSVNPNYFGMVDQLIASRGRLFIGCWFSTFTGYINRLRGYHSDNDKTPGYEQGLIPSWYYAPPDKYDQMRRYQPLKQSQWAREFPTAWRLIDTGMEEFHKRAWE